MSESGFKFVVGIFIFIFLIKFFSGFGSRSAYTQSTRTVQSQTNVNIITQAAAADGLDLKAVGELVKKTKNAEDLETQLNKPGGVNNLDLDENDQVDYINVTEYGDDNSKGFSLTVELAKDDIQEIATIDIEKTEGEASVQIHGNEQMYGQNHYYHYRSPLTSFLIMSYLFSPHPFYRSSYGYGMYPGGYRSYRTVPMQSYRSTVAPMTRSSSAQRASSSVSKSAVKSPNAGKSATNVRAKLQNPSASQKSFQARNPSKNVRSGGFGRSTSRQTNARSSSSQSRARPSVRSSSSRRSGGFSRGK